MKLRRTAVVLALSLAYAGAQGADLSTIYRYHVLSDSVHQSARAQYQASIEELPQSRSGYLPLIAGSASIFRNDIERQIAPDLYFNTKVYAVTLSQPIFRLQNWIAITQAKQLVLQAEAILAAAQQDLGLRVAQAYFDVLLARDNVSASETQK